LQLEPGLDRLEKFYMLPARFGRMADGESIFLKKYAIVRLE
jgi:hypothetical protein